MIYFRLLVSLKSFFISMGTHALVVVNREGDIKQPNSWEEYVFIIDVWYQNQFLKNKVDGAFWLNQGNNNHPVAKFMQDNANRLRIDANLREIIGSLFN